MTPSVPPVGAGPGAVDPWGIPAARGGEWSVGGVGAAGEGAGAEEAQPASGFGELLGDALGGLAETQRNATEQAQLLATGQTDDVTAVVAAVQEASLSMQLAAQLRNKAVEAYTEIFHTQV